MSGLDYFRQELQTTMMVSLVRECHDEADLMRELEKRIACLKAVLMMRWRVLDQAAFGGLTT
ncbi:hypothetical protein GCM10007857_89830 [Bradyrhizobium iriomotense]|uniref:Transposase n=1 Tax=Bradyrhizobium iriomotense TaxID=441950 RepID=A0ABQ6BEJ8_9BRAD|nr:hypothetical protein GCM10007857_89830 [Bradyrhizobium iriomotense]